MAAAACRSSKFLTALLGTGTPSSTRAASAEAGVLSFNLSVPQLSFLSTSSPAAPINPSQQSSIGRNSRPISHSQRQRRQVAMASSDAAASMPQVQKSEQEWRTVLSPEQFRILRQKGTERPGTGKYDKSTADGIYECAACGTPLYKSTTKFNSGCGWPAFFEGLPGAITETRDSDGRRIEITCTACGGHLGHNFKGEGFSTPTDERHCVNSISLKFTPENK